MIILDTNVLSELMRDRPSTEVTAWFRKHPLTDLYTTAITEAEIFHGIELLSRSARRTRLLEAAEALFAIDLKDRVLGFSSEAARFFAMIAAQRTLLGRPISYADAQIAAIARVHRTKLATRNVADFRDCEVEIVNPWIAT